MGSIRVTVSDLTGGKTVIADLPDAAPIRRLLPALVSKMELPPDKYTISHKQSGRMLCNEDTLAGSGVKSGDLLRLLPDLTAGAGIPTRSFREIQLIESIVRHNDLISALDGNVLFAVFLYTEEDLSLSSYIRHNIRELHAMSGEQCIFFVIEEPQAGWQPDIETYLGRLSGKYFDAIWERLKTDSFKPFDKVKAYAIAERFGLLPNKLPCIVFFTELASKKILVVEFNKFLNVSSAKDDDYTDFFRLLFSHTQTAVLQSSTDVDSTLERLSKLLKADQRRRGQKATTGVDPTKLTISVIEIVGSLIKVFLG